MIEGTITWIAYDPSDPPPLDIYYLITDGSETDFGYYVFDGYSETKHSWCPNESCQFGADHITHYAVINLPKENQ